MWTTVGVDNDALLARCAEIMTMASPAVLTVDAATLRSGIAQNKLVVYHYQHAGGDGVLYEIVLEFVYSPRRRHYFTCTAFSGAVQPVTVIERIIDQGQVFAEGHQQSQVGALRPLGVPASPLRQLYELLPFSPRLRVQTIGRTSDSEVWRIELSPIPEPVDT